MAKGVEVLALVRSALEGNREQVIGMCRIIESNEPASSSLKEGIRRLLSRTNMATASTLEMARDLKDKVLHLAPTMSVADIELPEGVARHLAEFLEEQACAAAIRSEGLPVAHKVLLDGPPGNGKTTLAGALALALNLPFYVMDFSGVVTSHLGETSTNMAKVFRGVAERPCVLFIDEMETVLTERAGHGGVSDVGEMRRVVSTLLMEIDRLPDHVILVGATNHEEMLDRAVVRRFDHHWSLPLPDELMAARWLQRFAQRHSNLPILERLPAIQFAGKSISAIELEVKAWCRRWIVEQEAARSAAKVA